MSFGLSERYVWQEFRGPRAVHKTCFFVDGNWIFSSERDVRWWAGTSSGSFCRLASFLVDGSPQETVHSLGAGWQFLRHGLQDHRLFRRSITYFFYSMQLYDKT